MLHQCFQWLQQWNLTLWTQPFYTITTLPWLFWFVIVCVTAQLLEPQWTYCSCGLRPDQVVQALVCPLCLCLTWLHVPPIISPSSPCHQTSVHLDSTLFATSECCLNNLVNMSVFIHYPASHHDQACRFNEANRYFCSDCLALPQSIKTIKWTHLFLIRS